MKVVVFSYVVYGFAQIKLYLAPHYHTGVLGNGQSAKKPQACLY